MAAMEEGSILTRICRMTLVVFTILLLIMGLGCIGVGIWMYADRYVYSYFIVFRRYYDDRALSASPGLFIVAGIICILMALLGFVAVRKDRKQYLLLYSIFLLLILILELVVGFMAVVFRHQIHQSLKNGMIQSLEKQYEFDNDVGKAWNFIQVRQKCCGADGSWDYLNTKWFHAQNKQSNDLWEPEVYVPITCCVLDFNQDRDPRRVNPQDPRPKDEKRCQEDAAGKKISGDYVHARGCFARILELFDKYEYINVLICIGLIVGFIQLVGFFAAAYLTCWNDKRDDNFVTQQQPFVQQQLQRHI